MAPRLTSRPSRVGGQAPEHLEQERLLRVGLAADLGQAHELGGGDGRASPPIPPRGGRGRRSAPARPARPGGSGRGSGAGRATSRASRPAARRGRGSRGGASGPRRRGPAARAPGGGTGRGLPGGRWPGPGLRGGWPPRRRPWPSRSCRCRPPRRRRRASAGPPAAAPTGRPPSTVVPIRSESSGVSGLARVGPFPLDFLRPGAGRPGRRVDADRGLGGDSSRAVAASVQWRNVRPSCLGPSRLAGTGRPCPTCRAGSTTARRAASGPMPLASS